MKYLKCKLENPVEKKKLAQRGKAFCLVLWIREMIFSKCPWPQPNLKELFLEQQRIMEILDIRIYVHVGETIQW